MPVRVRAERRPHGPPARTDEPGWLLGHNRARHAGDGYASVDQALWTTDGRLVAYATQVMFFALGV